MGVALRGGKGGTLNPPPGNICGSNGGGTGGGFVSSRYAEIFYTNSEVYD